MVRLQKALFASAAAIALTVLPVAEGAHYCKGRNVSSAIKSYENNSDQITVVQEHGFNATQKENDYVREQLDKLPSSYKKILKDMGFEIVLYDTSLEDVIFPDMTQVLADMQFTNSASSMSKTHFFYIPKLHMAYINIKEAMSGELLPSRNVILHEAGHALDQGMGWVSQSKAFRDAAASYIDFEKTQYEGQNINGRTLESIASKEAFAENIARQFDSSLSARTQMKTDPQLSRFLQDEEIYNNCLENVIALLKNYEKENSCVRASR